MNNCRWVSSRGFTRLETIFLATVIAVGCAANAVIGWTAGEFVGASVYALLSVGGCAILVRS